MDEKYVLVGQSGWATKLAEGLRESGLPVEVVPLGSVRDALNPRAWSRVHSASVLLRVGFRPGAVTWRGRAFDAALRLAGRRARVVCYWIGTDVLRLADELGSGRKVAAWRAPALAVDHHWAGSEPLRRELADAGISANVIPFPWRTVAPPGGVPPFQDTFTVLTYVPDARADFYGGPLLLEVARRFPSIQFEVMGGTGAWATAPPDNVHFLGWVENTAEAYARASCVMRLVEHDSIGGTAVEGLMFGRHVLYSQDLNHTRRVERTVESVSAALGHLLERSAAGLDVPNQEAADWARREFDAESRFANLAGRLAELPTLPRQPRLTYLTLQATTEGQAAHAHVHEIVRGLANGGWSSRVLKPSYDTTAPSVLRRLAQFAAAQRAAVAGLSRSDVFYVRSHFAALPAATAARWLRKPVVQEVNGPHEDALVAWPVLRRVHSWVERANRLQFRSADAVITVTPQLVSWLEVDAGVRDGHLVSNGADVERFTPRATRPAGLPERYVVFFGALAPWQGIEIALDATEHEAWPVGVPLVVVGDGQMREVVEQRADGHRVVYLGRRPYGEMPGIVSGSLASMLPMAASVDSGDGAATRDHAVSGLAPLKLFESMACGVPVIASDLPGMAETITKADCGVLVKPGDAGALARAVSALTHDVERAMRMGERGRASAVHEHSWRSRADDTASVLASVRRSSDD